MNQILAILIANLALIGAFGLLFYKSWLDLIRPDWFFIFRIYENGFLNYQEKKFFLPISGRKDSYKVGNCEYDKSGVKPYINPKGVYTWDFEQGQNKPINYQPGPNIDGQLIAEVKKAGNKAIDDIVSSEGGFDDFLKTWGVVIIGILILGAIGYMITSDKEASRITTELLINMSRRGSN